MQKQPNIQEAKAMDSFCELCGNNHDSSECGQNPESSCYVGNYNRNCFDNLLRQDDKGDVSVETTGPAQTVILAGLQTSAERLSVLLAYP
ncbi:hypothetical protein V6N13_006206 [Hibiscus sabdariffa]